MLLGKVCRSGLYSTGGKNKKKNPPSSFKPKNPNPKNPGKKGGGGGKRERFVPCRIKDPNDNFSEAAFNTLGMPAAWRLKEKAARLTILELFPGQLLKKMFRALYRRIR